MKLGWIFFAFLLPLVGGNACAEQFQNAYMSFELPANWECRLEETEWVCGDRKNTDKRGAIIIMTAKEVGPMDRLDLYEDHLSTPAPVVDGDGNSLGRFSQVEFVRQESIEGVDWIHARQFESEVPGWYTDYFAGIKDNIAILVTFSAYEQEFASAYAQFYPSMSTIRTLPMAK